MRKLLVAVTIGMVAGILDVIPMIIQKLDWYSNVAAFVFWIVTAIIISYSVMPIKNWLKGGTIGFISALPVMILVFSKEPKSVIPMFIMSIILGSLVGIYSGNYSDNDKNTRTRTAE